jgi:hypothetical protein
MKRSALLRNLLAAGLDSSLGERAIDAGFKLSTLRTAAKKSLRTFFDDDEIKLIQESLQRQPIPGDVIEQLIDRCDWSCCLCWDVHKHVSIIIHHLEEHAKGGGDTYDNLVILCLHHHGLAHSKWEISKHPAPVEYIKKRKIEFEQAIADFKSGTRAAPGREGDASDQILREVKQQLRAYAHEGLVLREEDIQSKTKAGNWCDRAARFVKETLGDPAEFDFLHSADGAGKIDLDIADDIKRYLYIHSEHLKELAERLLVSDLIQTEAEQG